MNHIKFRAKVNGNGNHYEEGQWVKGFYAEFDGKSWIYDNEENFVSGMGDFTRYQWIDVKPETVGQYIGINDCENKEIFVVPM